MDQNYFSNNITDENHMFGLSNEHLVDIPTSASAGFCSHGSSQVRRNGRMMDRCRVSDAVCSG